MDFSTISNCSSSDVSQLYNIIFPDVCREDNTPCPDIDLSVYSGTQQSPHEDLGARGLDRTSGTQPSSHDIPLPYPDTDLSRYDEDSVNYPPPTPLHDQAFECNLHHSNAWISYLHSLTWIHGRHANAWFS